MLDLNQLSLFVEIVRAGSFAAASRRLGMPANTVSRHIRQLEAAMDTRLMHRSTRKLTLTAAGQAFFERCAPPVGELLRAGQELADGHEHPSGTLRIAAPAGFFDFFSVAWLAEFFAMYPQVRTEFVLDDAKTDLVDQAIDIAFRSGRLLEPHTVGRKLLDSRFGLVASPAYLAARGQPRDVQALAAHDCLPLAQHFGPVVWRLQGPGGIEEVSVSGRFRANAAGAVVQAAVAGLGIALLPEALIVPDLEAGRLHRALPQYRQEDSSLYAIFPSRRQLSRAVVAFVDFAAERLRPPR